MLEKLLYGDYLIYSYYYYSVEYKYILCMLYVRFANINSERCLFIF